MDRRVKMSAIHKQILVAFWNAGSFWDSADVREYIHPDQIIGNPLDYMDALFNLYDDGYLYYVHGVGYKLTSYGKMRALFCMIGV